MTDDIEVTMPLDDAQQARAAALAFARSTLTDSTTGPFAGSETLPKRFGTQDLIDVAQWILDGSDPLAAYREEAESRRIAVVRVPADQVEAVERLNPVPSQDFPGGLLIVPAEVG